jgi:multisubunit Na+/H+ antiporter MnhC subunit
MNDDDIKRKVDKTLSMLDSVQRAKANPFFYTRLKARIDEQTAKHGLLAQPFPAWLVLTIIGIALLALLNVYSFSLHASQRTEALKQQELAQFAEQYNLTYTQY